MDELKMLLDETAQTQFDDTKVRQILPEVFIACERMKQKRAARMQAIAFALCALVMLLLLYIAFTQNKLFYLPIGGAAVTLIAAPILVYFNKEDNSYEA